MKRVAAAVVAALLCASGAFAVPGTAPNQAAIDGDAMPRKLSEFGVFRAGTSEPVDALPPTARPDQLEGTLTGTG